MSIRLDIEHIAGILEGRATLQPGVNAVRAHNWQGKSSFVEAIETALGVATTLTEGESAGSVTLSHDGAAYTVELDRNDGTVRRRGTPYLEAEYDRICTRLYACLDDANPIRRAVRNGENLEAHLTRPLEFEDIDAQIDALKAQQRTTERDLERAENAAQTLSDARESVAELEAELESLRQQRAALPDDGQRAESGDRSGDRQELGQIRARRSRLTERIERLENTIDRSTAKLDSLRTRLEGLDVPEVDLDSELAAARTKRDRIERDAELLQGLYSANKRILEEGRVDLVADVERSVLADELDCWVCGSNAGIDDINSRVESLGETVRSLNREAATVGEEIDELAARRAEATAARRTKRTLEDEILALEETLADRRESLSDARQQRADVDRRIEALAAAVEETDDRRTDVTAEIKYTESKLADEREHVAALEREADRREHLESTVAGLRADIAALRDRKRTVKRHTRAAFDESIRELVSRFETSFESARLTSTYDIVVAREGREVSIDALSEGEVELLGIVAALAGYEAYDVSDITPVLVLDRIGGLADENLHTLVEYLRDEPDYLVFTAYPEHSPFEGHQIDPGEWHVVSDDYDRPVVS